jgi:hypothetical protein
MRHTSPLSPRHCTLHCWTSPRRRWPRAVALVMWNMKRRHSFHSCKTAAAEAAVKADRREPRSGRSVAESLYGRPERRLSRGSATGGQQRRTAPPERRQLAKELISSPRELNSFLSGMEYRSHSGAKRRLTAPPATRTPALYFQHVNAAATGIGRISHNCFIFNGCHIATCKRLIFRAFSI